MEPIFWNRRWLSRGFAILGLVVGSGTCLGEEVILTVASRIPEASTWPCEAEGAQLVAIDAQGATSRLAGEFQVACEPTAGVAGRSVYFTGRRTAGEAFRIWHLDPATGNTSPLTPVAMPARSPFNMANGALGFLSGGELFRWIPDEERIEQLTFSSGRLESAAVLPDGRILFLSRSQELGRLFSMLPDGTWSTLWPGLDRLSVRDFAILPPEHLLLVDATGSLWRASIPDPYAALEPISVEGRGEVRTLSARAAGGAFLVLETSGPGGRASTGVSVVDFASDATVISYNTGSDQKVLSIASWSSARPPTVLPSIVKPDTNTGFLFVIDVARSDDPELEGLTRDEIATTRLIRLDADGSEAPLMTLEPESDGSLYLEVPADTPLAMELLNPLGDVLARSRTPFWVRPNERRGCVGCHVSPAYAPPNGIPLALLQEPGRPEQGGEVSP